MPGVVLTLYDHQLRKINDRCASILIITLSFRILKPHTHSFPYVPGFELKLSFLTKEIELKFFLPFRLQEVGGMTEMTTCLTSLTLNQKRSGSASQNGMLTHSVLFILYSSLYT